MADLLHLVDKPEGWTSHDVVARMRRILRERRVGHAGTLDPFATGLLIVAEGRATALLGCLSLLPKRYLAKAHLGVATDTQDRTGVPIRVSERVPGQDWILAAVERLRGQTRQRPPLLSAVKVPRARLTSEEAAGLRQVRAPSLGPQRIEPAPLAYPLPPGEPGWPLALLAPEGDLLGLGGSPCPGVGSETTPSHPPIRLLRVFP